jgi:hypothetical protein
MAELPDHLVEYRNFLIAAEQKAQEDFDKTVLSLSGGALGISFIFLKDVLGSQPIRLHEYLLGAWICWGASTLFVLGSFFLSHLALRHAIRQVDGGDLDGKTPGGAFAQWTATFNILGAVLFVVGVVAITVFAGANISTRGATNGTTQSTTSAAAPAAAAASTGTPAAAASGERGAGKASTGN